MASINDIYASGSNDHLKAADLIDPATGIYRVIQAVVSGTEVVDFAKDGEKPDQKIVLSFEGQDKTVVVNKTNATNLGARYGIDFDGWVGKTVLVTGSPKSFNGGMVPGIDLSAPLVPDAAADFAQQASADAVTSEEDIPF